jgi:hypothetical protein
MRCSTLLVLPFAVALLAWGCDRGEGNKAGSEPPGVVGKIKPGRDWFCRAIVFFSHNERSVWRLGYCFESLPRCEAHAELPLGGGMDTWDSGGGDVTRIAAKREAFPHAFCYRPLIAGDVSVPRPDDYRCFIDIVLCAAARLEEEGRKTECVTMSRPD